MFLSGKQLPLYFKATTKARGLPAVAYSSGARYYLSLWTWNMYSFCGATDHHFPVMCFQQQCSDRVQCNVTRVSFPTRINACLFHSWLALRILDFESSHLSNTDKSFTLISCMKDATNAYKFPRRHSPEPLALIRNSDVKIRACDIQANRIQLAGWHSPFYWSLSPSDIVATQIISQAFRIYVNAVAGAFFQYRMSKFESEECLSWDGEDASKEKGSRLLEIFRIRNDIQLHFD